MFGPPSSPPPFSAVKQEELKTALLPAFGHNDRNQKSSKPKSFIYQDEEATKEHSSAFLPTPLPTSEANLQTSSPPPSSPQYGSIANTRSNEISKPSLDIRSAPFALQQMLVIRVPTSGQSVTVGRSSKSSSFALRPSNRLASRVHGRLSFNSDENLLMIECLGWNGLIASVPQEPSLGGGKKDYTVSRGQILNIERVEGITLNIHGDKALIEFWNDGAVSELTEDETWSQSDLRTVSSPPRKRVCLPTSENKENQHIGGDLSPPLKKNQEQSPHETVSKGLIMDSQISKNTELAPEASAATNQVQDPSGNGNLQQPEGSQQKENNGNSSVTLLNIKEETEGSRASSVDPVEGDLLSSSSKKSRRQHKPISEEVKLELMNIAANHIAFSRQSAVPFSSVRKANSTLQSLPKHQVYEIVRSIPCIGVIEGGVEDTTGRRADDEYYYDIAKDDNEERRRVVQSTKGHRSLRNCRKTPKQYFYRPLHLD